MPYAGLLARLASGCRRKGLRHCYRFIRELDPRLGVHNVIAGGGSSDHGTYGSSGKNGFGTI